jgi:hypothetical protein
MKVQRYDLVLAFYPNARGFAHVVFEGPFSPVDWGITDVRGKGKTRRCLDRLGVLLERYRPDVLVLKQMPIAANGTKNANLLNLTAELAQRKAIPTFSLSRKQIQDAFASIGTTSRYAIAETIARRIPMFAPLLPPVRKIWNGEDRRMGLFDAAALVFTFFKSSKAVAEHTPRSI